MFYSDPTFDLSYANVRILLELKEALFGAKMLKLAKSFTSNGLRDSLIWRPDSMTQTPRQ